MDNNEQLDLNLLSAKACVEILKEHPEQAATCNWSKFSGFDFAELLAAQPQFADKCDWSKLDDWEWKSLLEAQPQFADKRP